MIQEHTDYYKQIVNTQGPNSFRNYSTTLAVSDTREIVGKGLLNEGLDFSIRFYCAAFTESVIQWVNDDMAIPPDVMAHRLFISMPGNLRFFFLPKTGKNKTPAGLMPARPLLRSPSE
jgi:hypothetical protein